ncbi:MAG: hypothetical protein K2V38_29090 [Gemmataceae bacterium]|nr:hypothetical protein [Gemmataceae bacterium]
MRAAILTLLLAASPALATSYARPERHDVYSHNRAFVLDVNPETRTHTVYDVRDRSKPLWSFSCGVWHFPFLLSDDGQVAATVGWKHVREQDIAEADAVTFWNKGGEFRSHALRDLCPDPPRTQDVGVGPIGAFWRTWYTEVEDHGDSFTIRTTVGIAYRFRYADGELVERRRFGFHGWGGWWSVGGGIAVAGVGVALWRWRRRHPEQAAPAGRPDAEPGAEADPAL